jgi:hypothetical protein
LFYWLSAKIYERGHEAEMRDCLDRSREKSLFPYCSPGMDGFENGEKSIYVGLVREGENANQGRNLEGLLFVCFDSNF